MPVKSVSPAATTSFVPMLLRRWAADMGPARAATCCSVWRNNASVIRICYLERVLKVP